MKEVVALFIGIAIGSFITLFVGSSASGAVKKDEEDLRKTATQFQAWRGAQVGVFVILVLVAIAIWLWGL